jgi:uncharacterized repeat protein (TIGR04042 family)
MPETYSRARWPNGPSPRCYPPSTVIEDTFAVWTAHPVADLVDWSRQALGIASEVVPGATATVAALLGADGGER